MEVYVIDISKHRIKQIKRINPLFKCFINNAMEMKNIQTGSIDFLVSTQVIEHVKDDKKMVKEISRVLKKDGIAYISTIFKKRYGWYFYKKDGKWRLHPEHVREYTSDDQLINILKEENFQIIENKKNMLWFPIIEPIFRILKVRRDIFEIKFFSKLRIFKIPIIGYYEWELVIKKK